MMSRWKAQRRRPGQKGGQSPKAGLGLQRAQGLRSLGLQVSTWESWNLKHHPPPHPPAQGRLFLGRDVGLFSARRLGTDVVPSPVSGR